MTNSLLYFGEVNFIHRMSVNTREVSSRKAYEGCSGSSAEIEYFGDWSKGTKPALMGDSDALLLVYMLQSNGEKLNYDTLRKMLHSTVNNYGTIVSSLTGERPLPLNSPAALEVSNVIGTYFKDGSTTSLQNLPSKADSDYIRYRSMMSGSVISNSGLEVNKILDAAAIYAEDHWYWEVDEAAMLGGTDFPGRHTKWSNKVETKVEFPTTRYYRTDYTQKANYNCLVSVPRMWKSENSQYSPLDSFVNWCFENAKPSRGRTILPANNLLTDTEAVKRSTNRFADVPETQKSMARLRPRRFLSPWKKAPSS